MREHPVILFDGVCNLCNAAVQFVIKYDREKLFRFASLQSDAGTLLLRNKYPDSNFPDSIILVIGSKFYTRSTAALLIARKLGGIISLLYGFIIVPAFIRNLLYKVIAKNRYKWFGRTAECMMPTSELQSRFL